MKVLRVHRAQCARSLGEKVCGPDHPARTYFRGQTPMLDVVELKEISKNWGIKFAHSLTTDHRWSNCNQPAAIRAAGLIVERAITGIVAILDDGADFRPHTAMMARTCIRAFWASLPKPGYRGH